LWFLVLSTGAAAIDDVVAPALWAADGARGLEKNNGAGTEKTKCVEARTRAQS
jgi:hypothetical protein